MGDRIVQVSDETSALRVLPRPDGEILTTLKRAQTLARLDDQVWSQKWLRVFVETPDAGAFEGYVDATATTAKDDIVDPASQPPRTAPAGASVVDPQPDDGAALDGSSAPKRIDRDAFYAAARKTLGATITPSRREGFDAILDVWEDRYATAPLSWLAYVMATAWHETGMSMKPVREGASGGKAITNEQSISRVTSLYTRGLISRNYALPLDNGNSYYGRGFVQLTFPDNYRKLGQRIGLGDRLYDQPDLALEADVAAKIICVGMIEGLFAADRQRKPHTLARHLQPERPDWVSARRIINGVDCAEKIAAHGQNFHLALIGAAVETAPPAAPREPSPQGGDIGRSNTHSGAASGAAPEPAPVPTPAPEPAPQKPLSQSRTIWAALIAAVAWVMNAASTIWSGLQSTFDGWTRDIPFHIELKWVLLGVALLALLVIVYARWDDHRKAVRSAPARAPAPYAPSVAPRPLPVSPATARDAGAPREAVGSGEGVAARGASVAREAGAPPAAGGDDAQVLLPGERQP